MPPLGSAQGPEYISLNTKSGGIVGVGGAWEAGWGPCADPGSPRICSLSEMYWALRRPWVEGTSQQDHFGPITPAIYMQDASEWTIDHLSPTNELYHSSTPATLETIDTSHSFILIISIGDTPEIVEACTLLFGPTNGLPL